MTPSVKQHDGGRRRAAKVVEHVPHGIAEPRGLAVGAVERKLADGRGDFVRRRGVSTPAAAA